MKRIPLLIVIALSTLLLAVSVHAQTGSTPLDENSATLSLVETIPVTANVEVNLNGQVYKLAIPVTIDIDTQKDLADALLIAKQVDSVGDLQWKIVEIEEYTDEFELTRYNVVEPSSRDNKLVVFESQLTNLGAEPFEYYRGVSDLYAYDELGNLFDSSERSCDDINPGATLTCTVVFDVPENTNLLGLDLKVTDHKRIPFTEPE